MLVSQHCHNNVPEAGGLNNRNLCSYTSGGLQSGTQVSVGLVPSTAASLSHVGFLSPAHTSVNSPLLNSLAILVDFASASFRARPALVPWPVRF